MQEKTIDKNAYIERMADNLPTLRAKLNLTQEELAVRIGVSRHTVISMEKKKRPMTWNTFLSLILVFSYSEVTKKLLCETNVCNEELRAFLSKDKS